ncbi:unknown protein [Microcystis aeruginosa NIES-298]|nr:unknown protein [Microcystis aeruginosa NIES-298]
MVFHCLLTPKILRLTGLDLNRFTRNRKQGDGGKEKGEGRKKADYWLLTTDYWLLTTGS